MQTPIILLPDRVYILRGRKNQTIKTNREEYTIYFENVIFPCLPEYDVQSDCGYGRNLGHFWRIDDFTDDSGFPLTIKVFDNFTGEPLCEKTTTVFLTASKQSERRFTLLAIGDSMTQSEIYLEHAGAEDSPDTYVFDGFTPEPIDGRFYLENGKLMRNGVTVDDSPHFRFDFGGYMKRWKIPAPDAVSILLGCNDLASKSYADYKPALDRLIGNLWTMIDSIREAVLSAKILLMTPIPGASGYAWGLSRGCSGSAAMYRHIIAHTAERMIAEFGSRENEGIYIVPSHMTIDPVYGYKNDSRKANIHSEHLVFVNTDGIHPNPAGYKQMGDALAGVIEAVRN